MYCLGPSDATHHPPVGLTVAIALAWVDVRAVEVHVVSAATTVPRSGPIVPAGSTVVDRRTIHAPGMDEVVRI